MKLKSTGVGHEGDQFKIHKDNFVVYVQKAAEFSPGVSFNVEIA